MAVTLWQPWVPLERTEQPELLDLGYGTDRDTAHNLKEMDRYNRWLGGDFALLHHLLPRLESQAAHSPVPITVADLGSGSAALPHRLAGWAAKRRISLVIFAVDWSLRNLRCAATVQHQQQPDGAVQLVCASATDLPFEQVDFVISTLFLHHFPPESLQSLLRTAARRAHRGLVMSDLVRGRLPLAAFRLSQPVFARSYLTRHDGALSIRRAYTPPELSGIAAQAGLPSARVYPHFPWRMTLVVDL